ncbi:MAG: cytochrome-c oxidase, cbb3-type subunit III [Gammaproteobacteria bacterium]
MSQFWNIYIIVIVVFTVVACMGLLWWTKKFTVKDTDVGKTLDHDFDGIREYNNPMPSWWLWTFYLTAIFLVAYLVIYPGFGFFEGALKWTSRGELKADQDRAREKYGALYKELSSQPVESLIHNPQAMRMGQRLFANHCAACHGADGRGSIGFPNLTDTHWIYGGTPAEIKTTITSGRQGMMPPQERVLGSDKVIQDVVQYVLKLNHKTFDAAAAERGEQAYQRVCAVCHGQDAEGNKQIGAPNLKNNAWTFGGTPLRIEMTVRYGRQAQMPAHENILTSEKIHLLTAFVYSLSQPIEQGE